MPKTCLPSSLVLLALASVSSGAVRARQGSLEFPLPAVQDPRTVDALYGYDTILVSSAASGFERAETSLLFLHQAAGIGPLSLVVINDIANDATGGESTFALAGLTPSTIYVVRDDPPDGFAPDPPALGQTTATLSWSPCCTDGFALTGLHTAPFCASVAPSFVSGIVAWEVIAGPGPVSRTALPSLTETLYLCSNCQSLSCPPLVSVDCGDAGGADVQVLAAGASLCSGGAIANDFNAGGADASGRYPVGNTIVTFTLSDAAGFESVCATQVVVNSGPDPIPPDQGNVLLGVQLRTGNPAHVDLRWTGTAAANWRVYRDPAKEQLGVSALGPDVAVDGFVDPGRVAPFPGIPVDYYRVRGLSPCTFTPGP